MLCSICSTPLVEGFLKCKLCKHWNISSNSSNITDKLSSTLASIKLDTYKRISCGPWDACFGEDVGSAGIVLGSSTLLGGEPGAGKSTLALQIANAVAGKIKDKPVLYAAAEEGLSSIKYRSERLKCLNTENIQTFDLIRNNNFQDCLSEIEKLKPSLFILDSISGLAGEDLIYAVNVAKEIKKYCDGEHKCPAIIVAHVNKQIQFGGKMALQHEVDTIIGFVVDGSDATLDNGEEDERFLVTLKNRFGRSKVKIYFRMTEGGLIEKEESDVDVKKYMKKEKDSELDIRKFMREDRRKVVRKKK